MGSGTMIRLLNGRSVAFIRLKSISPVIVSCHFLSLFGSSFPSFSFSLAEYSHRSLANDFSICAWHSSSFTLLCVANLGGSESSASSSSLSVIPPYFLGDDVYSFPSSWSFSVIPHISSGTCVWVFLYLVRRNRIFFAAVSLSSFVYLVISLRQSSLNSFIMPDSSIVFFSFLHAVVFSSCFLRS